MRDKFILRRTLLAVAVGVWPASRAGARGVGGVAGTGRRTATGGHVRVVVLDPGHGGSDPGAISPHGFYEKNITLPTAREVARLLDASGRYRPLLTRRRDIFVPLRERVELAHAARADLFLSIHADALPNAAMRGLAVYTLSAEASDREAAELARSENRDIFLGGELRLSRQEPPVIAAILFDMARRHTDRQSQLLARAIVGELGSNVRLLDQPHRSAAFVVLTAPDIPSALVELGCLSNPEDERLLPTPAYQHRLAQGLARAIDDYFSAATAA
jgi:N-acetylmuramoyl-L-alanine amidase